MLKKRYIITSMVIHSLFLLLGIFGPTQKAPKEKPIEVNLESKSKGAKKPKADGTIIPIGQNGNKAAEKKNGYYGIGIYSTNYMVGPDVIIKVSQVIAGYPADLAGIEAGDLITEVDGQPLSTKNDIRGPAEANIVLKVIKKDGSIVYLKIRRSFISTDEI
jgi:membrane-associated protease RseP (regulator of RpoE activity)